MIIFVNLLQCENSLFCGITLLLAVVTMLHVTLYGESAWNIPSGMSFAMITKRLQKTTFIPHRFHMDSAQNRGGP